MLTTVHCIRPAWPAPDNVLALSTTRQLRGDQDSGLGFNLGQHVGDDPLRVAANRAELARELPAGSHIQWLQQVHGSRVVEAGDEGGFPEADGCWSSATGMTCAVMTADCLPVLFCSASGEVVAAAHAGWRGLAAGVLEATVAAMAVAPSTILAWLGPAIGPAYFEVGEEVREIFGGSAQAPQLGATNACFTSCVGKPGHYMADLCALARIRLLDLGLAGVYGGNLCTYGNPGQFFSYRRDGQTGRMASLITLLS